MFVFDLTNLFSLFLVVIATILFIYLSQEIKNSKVVMVPLFAFLVDLVIHTIQVLTLSQEFAHLYSTLCYNIVLDFIFVLITFLSYLWADEVEAKALNKKTINSKGINWLWKKV